MGDLTFRKYNGLIERYLERRSGLHVELVATGTQGQRNSGSGGQTHHARNAPSLRG
jgi:hypothetical protein